MGITAGALCPEMAMSTGCNWHHVSAFPGKPVVVNCATIIDCNMVLAQFELLQKSRGGDLVLGECMMKVSDVVAAGAVHSWFPFMDAADPELKAGELLMAIQAKERIQNRQDARKKIEQLMKQEDETKKKQLNTGVEQSVSTSAPVRPQNHPDCTHLDMN
jgi:hypothetical protein